MKQTIKSIAMPLFIAVFALVMTSCGSSYNPEDAAKMIEKNDNGEMTQEDYSKCIEWIGDYYKARNKASKDILDKADSLQEVKELSVKKEKEFNEEWENIDEIINIVSRASYSEKDGLDKANAEKWEKVKDDNKKESEKNQEKAREKFKLPTF